MTFPDEAFAVEPTILVIDDDRILTMLFERVLASTGKVITSNSGGEGLDLARQLHPDLILLDVQMPGQDGFDVISELKTDPAVRHIPVIFITAEVLPEIESHCLEAGAADYIAKPVNPRVLQARARTHLLIKQQADLLADLSYLDALTGALNRKAFEWLLAAECGRAAWKNRPISLLVVDVDQFASYNAIYGHLAGDDALEAIVASMRSEVSRPGQVVARLAGDRFAVLLPEVPGDEAAQTGDRICAGVRHLGLRHSGSPPAEVLTVSCGVASGTGGATDADLVRAAEAQLRRAKDSGRDRVCTAG
jgi:diguanylate cyclase (GGDEF)-like protein